MFLLKQLNCKINPFEVSFPILLGEMFTPVLSLVAKKFQETAGTWLLFFYETSQQPKS